MKLQGRSRRGMITSSRGSGCPSRSQPRRRRGHGRGTRGGGAAPDEMARRSSVQCVSRAALALGVRSVAANQGSVYSSYLYRCDVRWRLPMAMHVCGMNNDPAMHFASRIRAVSPREYCSPQPSLLMMLAAVACALAFVHPPALRPPAHGAAAARAANVKLSDAGTIFSEQELKLIEQELTELRNENEKLRSQVDGTAFSDDELALIEGELASLASDKKVLDDQVKLLEKEKYALEGKLLAKESEVKRALEAQPEGELQVRVEELETQLKRLQSDKSILLQSSRRHFDRYKSAIAELEMELSTARFELDRATTTLSLTEESYEKFRGRNALSLLAYGVGRSLDRINKKIKGTTGRAASKIGNLRRQMWLSSVSSANAAPRSAASRSLVSSR
jgi:hypothetical protein